MRYEIAHLTPQQLEESTRHIGGSKAGAIFGFNEFMSRWHLWLIMTGQMEPDDISERQPVIWGNYLEPAIAANFADEMGVRVQRINTTWRHKDYPWMVSHPDRRIAKSRAIMQIKNVGIGQAHKWGRGGTREIPDNVLCQVQHEMATSNGSIDLCFVVALIGGNERRIYEIPRDDEFITEMIEGEAEFMAMVVNRIHPGIDFDNPNTMDLLKRMYPGTNGQIVDLPPQFEEIHRRLKKVGEVSKKLEDYEKSLKSRLLAYIGQNSAGRLEDGSMYRRRPVPAGAPYTATKAAYVDFRHINAPRIDR